MTFKDKGVDNNNKLMPLNKDDELLKKYKAI